jgi:ketosteroid isomerase-like protein
LELASRKGRAVGENEDIVRRCIEVWNSGDLSPLDELLAADYVGHVGSSDHDGAELRKRIVAYRSRTPGVHFSVLDQTSDEVRVASWLEAAAEVDGRPIRTRGMNICVIKDGKLSEEWAVWESSA